MIAALLALVVSAAPVQAELPWAVTVTPGAGAGASQGPCGPRRIAAGVVGGVMTPVVASPANTASWRVPLRWQPGLFGLDGDLFVVAAADALRAARVEGTVTLQWQTQQAWLAISTPSPAATVAAALTAFVTDGRQFTALLQAANARRAWRHSRVGTAALDQVDGMLCFPTTTLTPTTTTATPATIRAALAAPVLPPL